MSPSLVVKVCFIPFKRSEKVFLGEIEIRLLHETGILFFHRHERGSKMHAIMFASSLKQQALRNIVREFKGLQERVEKLH